MAENIESLARRAFETLPSVRRSSKKPFSLSVARQRREVGFTLALITPSSSRNHREPKLYAQVKALFRRPSGGFGLHGAVNYLFSRAQGRRTVGSQTEEKS